MPLGESEASQRLAPPGVRLRYGAVRAGHHPLPGQQADGGGPVGHHGGHAVHRGEVGGQGSVERWSFGQGLGAAVGGSVGGLHFEVDGLPAGGDGHGMLEPQVAPPGIGRRLREVAGHQYPLHPLDQRSQLVVVLRRAEQEDERRVLPLLFPGAFPVAFLDGGLPAGRLQRPNRVVSRRRVLADVSRQPYVEDHTLDVHISALRRKLGEQAANPRYLHTVRGVGLGLVAPP